MQIDVEPTALPMNREWRWDLVVWDTTFETGQEDIDDDHRHLFFLFNEFSTAVNEGKGALVIRGLLDELRDYAHDHFRREESLMLEYDYPDYARHKKMHDTFEKQINDVATHVDVSGDMAAFLLSFLAKWLSGHILSADQRFGAFLAEHGVTDH